MHHNPHPKKILKVSRNTAPHQDIIEEVIQPKHPSLAVLNQRWQNIRLIILKELAN